MTYLLYHKEHDEYLGGKDNIGNKLKRADGHTYKACPREI
jgi:hypothetical protein